MNFWEYKEDYSRGYYLPANNKAAYQHGQSLGRGFFALLMLPVKLAFLMAKGAVHLLYNLVIPLFGGKK